MPDVLQLITDTDGVRGAQVAAVQLGAALERIGTSVHTAALVDGTSTARLDVPVLPRGQRRRAIRASRVVLAAGSSTLWTAAGGTIGTGRGFVYRSIGDATAWTLDPVRRTRFALAVRRARAVVVLWPDAAIAMADRFGVDPERIAVIPQAAPAERFPAVDAAARTRARGALGIDGDGPIALYLGALSAEKQIDLAIDAVAGLRDVRLVIAGDGPLMGELQRRGGPDVRFLGAVADPALALAAADVLVLPSRTEGVPGVLVEAGLSGLPSVASAVGGVPSIVTDGVTGVLVPSGDVEALRAGITLALDTPELGAAAREHCLRELTLDAVAPRWQTVLERAMTPTA